MSKRIGLVITGDVVHVVEAIVPVDDGPVEILGDYSWKLPSGGSGQAYRTMHQTCSDFTKSHQIDLAIVKASAVPQGAVRLGVLKSAELRGVILAALSSATTVELINKSTISRTYGDRKVDEYLADDDFWNEHTAGGKLKKTSREAAMLIIATRDK